VSKQNAVGGISDDNPPLKETDEVIQGIGVALVTLSSLLALMLSGVKFDKKSAAIDLNVLQQNLARHFPNLFSETWQE
jgi:hypothetical protein